MSKTRTFKEEYVIDGDSSHLVQTKDLLALKAYLLNNNIIALKYANNVTPELLWTLYTQYGFVEGNISSEMVLCHKPESTEDGCNICDDWYLFSNSGV